MDDSSRHVPLHMQALMHQNLGALENTLAATAGSGSGSAAAVRKDLAAAHLESAYRHLLNSVAAFDLRRENLHAQAGIAEDRSALLEESLSLQLLAGVTCGLGKLREGVRRWEQAVRQARSSLLGIELGVRYANLAAVLYNAAVCHVAANRAAQAQQLATEAAGILADIARQGAEDEQHRALGAHLDTLLAQVAAIQSATPPAAAAADPEAVAGTVRRAAREAAESAALDGKVTYVSAAPQTGGQGDGGDEEEWLECELDEACDLYEVLETPAAVPGPSADAQAGAGDFAEADVLAGLDLRGMSAEDVEELREVRARYFRQSGAAAAAAAAGRSAGENKPLAEDAAHAGTAGAGLVAADALSALQGQVAAQAVAQEALLQLVRELAGEVKQLREEIRRQSS